jgi:hypothetical protein
MWESRGWGGDRTCLVDGCARLYRSRENGIIGGHGLCPKHEQQWRRAIKAGRPFEPDDWPVGIPRSAHDRQVKLEQARARGESV